MVFRVCYALNPVSSVACHFLICTIPLHDQFGVVPLQQYFLHFASQCPISLSDFIYYCYYLFALLYVPLLIISTVYEEMLGSERDASIIQDLILMSCLFLLLLDIVVASNSLFWSQKQQVELLLSY